MTELILSQSLAEQVARQPQGIDAIKMAEQGADLLEELKYYIPPGRIDGLHGARSVNGNQERFMHQVRACLDQN